MVDRYKQALSSLNEEQREAVERIDGPMLVIAGPGTGKTQLLTTRIAHILKTTDSLPENILCLTFTESAVNTMRERLNSLIGKEAYNVTISTYHAFGSSLRSRYPDYFQDYSDTRSIDELGSDTILREIIAEVPYSNPLKYSDNYITDIKKLISDAKQAGFSPDVLKSVAKANMAFFKKVNPVISDTLGEIIRIDKKSMPLFEQLLKKLQKLPLSLKPLNNDIEAYGVAMLGALETAVEDAAALGKQVPLTKWKNDWLEKDNNNRFIASGQKVAEKLYAASEIYYQYEQELGARGLYDYDDMILQAIKVLKENDDFRYSLQERYLYILLDEFQDTNGAQLSLVKLLTDNPASEGQPNVLAVGDDDQAIYAFQGANYSHMKNFQRTYKNVRLISLTKNYRSTGDILSSASAIAEQIEERLNRQLPGVNKNLVAVKKPNPGSIVERREAKSDVAQYGWVTKQIKQLLSSGTKPKEIAVLAPQHKYLEPLTAYLNQEKIPLRYEKSENVLDDPAINELARMSELVLALSKNDHQQADSIWPEVISYDFWELPTSLIWQLSWQTHDKKNTWTNVLLINESLRPMALFFIRLGLLSGSEPLEVMLDYLIGISPLNLKEKDHSDGFRTPFYEYYFNQPAGSLGLRKAEEEIESVDSNRLGTFWELLNNLTILRSRLRDYKIEEDYGLHLADLLEFIEAHRKANIKILNSSPHQEASDAVEIMTAYKAKGQEFKVVFLLAMNDEAWGTKVRAAGNRISLPPNLEFIRYSGATNDERLRLLYVAITRAGSQLYLVGYSRNFSGRQTSPLAYLEEQVDSEGEVESPFMPESSQIVKPAVSDIDLRKTPELVAYWRQRHNKSLTKQTMLALLRTRITNYQLSPTDISEFTDVVYGGPEEFFMYKLLRFPRAPTPEIRYGNAIHETLHWIHVFNKANGSIPSTAAAVKKYTAILKTQRLNKRYVELFNKRGRPVIKAYLEQRLATISPDNECEYSFRNEGVFIGEAHMSGKIDKLIIDRKYKTITIVDYKTGKTHYKWQRDVKMHRYQQQLYIYKSLVERSHSFAGYRVVDAYIEFVEPGEDGKIYELHIKFDDQTMQRIEKLAQSIWHHIQELDIPDTSGYREDIGGIEDLEDYLIDSSKSKGQQNSLPLD